MRELSEEWLICVNFNEKNFLSYFLIKMAHVYTNESNGFSSVCSPIFQQALATSLRKIHCIVVLSIRVTRNLQGNKQRPCSATCFKSQAPNFGYSVKISTNKHRVVGPVGP